jgi:hypothetical protein
MTGDSQELGQIFFPLCSFKYINWSDGLSLCHPQLSTYYVRWNKEVYSYVSYVCWKHIICELSYLLVICVSHMILLNAKLCCTLDIWINEWMNEFKALSEWYWQEKTEALRINLVPMPLIYNQFHTDCSGIQPETHRWAFWHTELLPFASKSYWYRIN